MYVQEPQRFTTQYARSGTLMSIRLVVFTFGSVDGPTHIRCRDAIGMTWTLIQLHQWNHVQGNDRVR